jgi:outer membrane protein assembly factor BamB
VTALQQSNGAVAWSYRTGGPIEDSGALADQGTVGGISRELIVGSADGYLYALAAMNGSFDFEHSVGGPVVGVAAADGVVLYETSSGVAGGGRTYSSLITWSDRVGPRIASAPAVVDGTIYISGEDGFLYAFTSYGQAPD